MSALPVRTACNTAGKPCGAVDWQFTTLDARRHHARSGSRVETYKARSLEKLGLRSRTDLVRFALLRGWLLAWIPSESGAILDLAGATRFSNWQPVDQCGI